MTRPLFTTRLITTEDEFAASRENWNALAGDRMFHRWEWMYSWWQSYRSTGELVIAVVMDQNNRWVGIAPWFKSSSAGRGQVVRTLASGLACSDYTSVAVRSGV